MMQTGEYRNDRMQRITGYMNTANAWFFNGLSGAFTAVDNEVKNYAAVLTESPYQSVGRFRFDSGLVTRTGAKTEPENVVLNGYIIVK